jgi:hypothetical protein
LVEEKRIKRKKKEKRIQRKKDFGNQNLVKSLNGQESELFDIILHMVLLRGDGT